MMMLIYRYLQSVVQNILYLIPTGLAASIIPPQLVLLRLNGMHQQVQQFLRSAPPRFKKQLIKQLILSIAARMAAGKMNNELPIYISTLCFTKEVANRVRNLPVDIRRVWG